MNRMRRHKAKARRRTATYSIWKGGKIWLDDRLNHGGVRWFTRHKGESRRIGKRLKLMPTAEW